MIEIISDVKYVMEGSQISRFIIFLGHFLSRRFNILYFYTHVYLFEFFFIQ